MTQYTMNIGGEERPLKFGVQQSINYSQLRNQSVSKQYDDLLNIGTDDGSIVRDLIWSALKDGARKEKLEFDYEPEDIADWMDELTADEVTKFVEALTESLKTSVELKSAKKKQTEEIVTSTQTTSTQKGQK